MKKTAIVLFLTLILAGCKDGSGKEEPLPQSVTGSIEIGDAATEWTYISLQEGTVVGMSSLGDPEADAGWAARTDWDIAVCGDLLRTNGGASGSGPGGVVMDGRTVTDAGDVQIW